MEKSDLTASPARTLQAVRRAVLPISKINPRRRILVPSSNDSIAFVETDTLIGTETIGAVLSQCFRWGLPEADVMPNTHETAVQMIDMSIVHVFRHMPALLGTNGGQWAGGAGLTSNIHAVVDTDTHQSDLGPKSTRTGADGTQARAGFLVRSPPKPAPAVREMTMLAGVSYGVLAVVAEQMSSPWPPR